MNMKLQKGTKREKKRETKRGPAVLIPLAFLLSISLCTSSAWAAEQEVRILYLKTQSFSYLYPKVDTDYMAAVYGKGEAVRVYGKKGNYYIMKHLGKTVYLPEKVVTAEKTRWVYFAKPVFRCLRLKEGSQLYLEPAKSSQPVVCRERQVYTLGETRNWYKVFVAGQVAFVKKNSRDIEAVAESEFPEILIDEFFREEKETVKNRVRYIYSLLPEKERKTMPADLKIHVVFRLPKRDYENMGAGAFASSDGHIWLKECGEQEPLYSVEMCLLHELGHMIQYSAYESRNGKLETAASLLEQDSLYMRSYYRKDREYLAETFEYYVKNPHWLERKAPATFAYFSSILL